VLAKKLPAFVAEATSAESAQQACKQRSEPVKGKEVAEGRTSVSAHSTLACEDGKIGEQVGV
jgi:hypothetical protein